ncbi:MULTISPECIES: sodium/sugar symporter [Rufibacter]|uniref:SSS family solute:Na+ symporter n=1 Tax=Rufibacter quisquiliarum TaxID=1549639 RepID=A0A839GX46_9BACT|nr:MULTISPECIES: sodium/sugar symporter [Rufibacter]MBA9079316.1 SSS family solute:Na+ symporter [Rufibacter quisquiliarum]
MGLETIDYVIFLAYFLIVSGYGYWIYRRKKSDQLDSKDFFLAEGSLTWWAIGASLIASNISAEQFIGMSGSGFAMGLAISTYEWMAAATLIVVAVFFIPIYLKNKIYTMPQFLSHRYNDSVSTIMAVFWLLVYVFVNLSSILYLGALAIETISGIDFYYCMIGLAIFAIFITLGGMKVIGYTDVIQVFVLVLGGLATTYLALDLVSDNLGGGGIFDGLAHLRKEAADHFSMILSEGEIMIPNGEGGTRDAYMDLPGLSVLIGGMWIINLNYWGCNQYITQRALGADLKTARSGILFAAFLKLLMPIIVVLPGIAAYVLHKNGMFQAEMANELGHVKPDHAYPVLLNLLPVGLKGLSFAALTAAIVASLAGKANSISTIFTLDIYKKFFNKNASETRLVNFGKLTVVAAFIIALIVAPALRNLDQAFQYIQEYTGFISPGVFAIFALGFFWKRTTSSAALVAAVLTIPLSTFLKFQFPEIPFIDRMGIVFVILTVLMIMISLIDPKGKNNPKGLEIDASMFKPNTSFTIGAVLICGILVGLYTIFW